MNTDPVPGPKNLSRAEQSKAGFAPARGGIHALVQAVYIKQRFKRPRMHVRGKHFMVPVCGGCVGSGTIRPKASGFRRESP
jgi:hypothetical protein